MGAGHGFTYDRKAEKQMTKETDWLADALESGRRLLAALPSELKTAVRKDARFRESVLCAERVNDE